MYCSNCGNKLEDRYNYCPKCGNKKEDNLYIKVKEFVLKNDTINVSMIQKEFKLNNEQAKEIMEQLEREKIVGEKDGKRKRMVYKNNKSNVETNKMNSNDMLLSLLSYLGPLALIPYLVNTDSKFVRYHSLQGMNLFIIWLIYTFINNVLNLIKISRIIDYGTFKASRLVTPILISYPLTLIGIGIGILSLVGIVYVIKGEEKELPIIGSIKIVK